MPESNDIMARDLAGAKRAKHLFSGHGAKVNFRVRVRTLECSQCQRQDFNRGIDRVAYTDTIPFPLCDRCGESDGIVDTQQCSTRLGEKDPACFVKMYGFCAPLE
jgi:hypothetical protein